ncbi:MAG: multidrug resistance efflux transporter family protein [Heyndrickxia faecalis]|mgnify:CR=1 FL=1|uniref:DMT family transporter n=1 Tax=Heyndrickxia TaxID=2837504 RepID=UPI000552E23A|nr:MULTISPECIES: multidrug resistance efflux transporter family protein [Heyndrickxia]KGT38293.1 membrane protein [Heyndrickxia coagulans P38]MCI1575678.1 multidrug resistance efflux transporter family protein [Heyndrickxia coagulans]MED4322768.1 multidrug resistance efflux transporter family protein [Weizmannia sp. CD-2023]MED4840802.1 multidrug resistance efflux transporter family protein [Weizmannia sp. CD-2023]MED4867274.1 multidrug resistance efflux transporter family protein [Weizmannia 
MLRPVLLGVCAAFFFAVTFVLNRSMELSGGSWIWSASLRYILMVPFLLVIVLARKNFQALWAEMKKHPAGWLLWSFTGFVLFYAPLCFSAAYAPGWLVAGTWQITILSGSLLAPFFFKTVETPKGLLKIREPIPFRGLRWSLVILLGVLMMQLEQAGRISFREMMLGVLPVIVATFAYPLGNRKMMELCEGRLDTFQRVLGMTLASLPFWFILSLYGLKASGPPSGNQIVQSGVVAVFSGVIATVLFFRATDLVRGDMQKLSLVEATQSLEVLFALFGEMAILPVAAPSLLSWFGIITVAAGMVLHSLMSRKTVAPAAWKMKKSEISG